MFAAHAACACAGHGLILVAKTSRLAVPAFLGCPSGQVSARSRFTCWGRLSSPGMALRFAVSKLETGGSRNSCWKSKQHSSVGFSFAANVAIKVRCD